MKFKKNAENFVNFYITSKQRNHKNANETSSLSSFQKDKDKKTIHQNEIKNLKNDLNNEIIRIQKMKKNSLKL